MIPGYLYHVTQRGNYRQNVFSEDQDRVVYLKLINENAKKYGVKIYAFCLMDNHVHFLLKPEKRMSMAHLFRVGHMKYARYYNVKNKRKGHLWQARYYSSMVVGKHIKVIFRYIENNPVRARMVKYAWHYSWSSARAHLGKKYEIIELADEKEYIDRKNWKSYLMKREDGSVLTLIRKRTKKGIMLATNEIIARMEEQLGVKILRKSPGRPKIGVCP